MDKKKYDDFLNYLETHNNLTNLTPIQIINDWGLTNTIEMMDVPILFKITNTIQQHPNILQGGHNEHSKQNY